MDHFLTLLVLLPLIGAIAVLSMRTKSTARWVALGTTLATLALSLTTIIFFDTHKGRSYGYDGGTMQLVEQYEGIAPLHLRFKVGVDGLSLPLVILTTFIMVIACVASWNIAKMQRGFLALLLIFEFACLGIFLSLNLIQFFAFFEFAALPIYLLVRIWGSSRIKPAMIRFFLCTSAGSIALLAAIIGIHHRGGTFDMILLAQPALQKKLGLVLGGFWGVSATTLFLLAVFSFLIKLRTIPFHGWLTPLHFKTHTPVGMVMTALLPMVGGYGLLRIAYPLFPHSAEMLWFPIAMVGLICLVYGGLCALDQTDLKRLMTYSTISRAGLFLLGIAMLTPASVNGALFMIIANAITGMMLSFIAGVFKDRDANSDIARFGAVGSGMPYALGFGMLSLLANAGVPCLCGFVGEILVIIGIFQAGRPDSVLHKLAAAHGSSAGFTASIAVIAAIACGNVVLTASYTLRAIHQLFLQNSRARQPAAKDLDSREFAVLTPLAAMAVLLGVLPMLVFSLSGMTIAAIFKLF